MKNVIKIACCVLTICMLTSCVWIDLIDYQLAQKEEAEINSLGEHYEYYQKIAEYEEENAEVDLRQIFTDFEWDQVFFVSRDTYNPDDVYEATGIRGDFYYYSGSPRLFALFTREKEVVYQFEYRIKELEFYPLEELIPYEEAVFSAEKDFWNTLCLSKKA